MLVIRPHLPQAGPSLKTNFNPPYSPLKECASIMNVGAAVWRRTVVFLTCNTKSSLSFFSSRCSITLFSRMGEFECCFSCVLYAEWDSLTNTGRDQFFILHTFITVLLRWHVKEGFLTLIRIND